MMEKLQDTLPENVCKDCKLGELARKSIPLTYSVGFNTAKNDIRIKALVCGTCENVVITDFHTKIMRENA